jgi:hypothetical protein
MTLGEHGDQLAEPQKSHIELLVDVDELSFGCRRWCYQVGLAELGKDVNEKFRVLQPVGRSLSN